MKTVVLLSGRKADDYVEVKLELDELDVTSAESKATYKEIQEYVGILARLARKEPASYMSFAIERLISVVEYMEAHLLEKIDYEKFAEIANCPALLTLVSYL